VDCIEHEQSANQKISSPIPPPEDRKRPCPSDSLQQASKRSAADRRHAAHEAGYAKGVADATASVTAQFQQRLSDSNLQIAVLTQAVAEESAQRLIATGLSARLVEEDRILKEENEALRTENTALKTELTSLRRFRETTLRANRSPSSAAPAPQPRPPSSAYLNPARPQP